MIDEASPYRAWLCVIFTVLGVNAFTRNLELKAVDEQLLALAMSRWWSAL